MVGLPSPDIQITPTSEQPAPQKAESKPITQLAKEMWQGLRARLSRPSPNPDEALREISTFPAPEEVLTSPPPRLLIEKPAIREFSRSTPQGRKTRSNTAQDILRLRAEAAEAQVQETDLLTSSRQMIQQSSERVEVEIAETEDQVLALRADLAERSTSWLAKARALVSRDFREETAAIAKSLPTQEERLEMKQGIAKLVQERNRAELERLERQFQELSEWYRRNPAGKETLQKFYSEQGKLLGIHQQNIEIQKRKAELERYKQEHGTVPEVAQKYGVYAVHGITLGPGGTNNEVLAHNASWKDKLMVIVSAQPPLSVSVFKEGGGPQQLWGGGVGVIIKEGIIVDAGGGDILSASTSIREKKAVNPAYDIEIYQRNLDAALSKNNTLGGYNEVILEFGSKPAAVYINLDQKGNTIFDDRGMQFKDPWRDVDNRTGRGHFFGLLERLSYDEIFETAEFVGLPVVVIKEGVVYESSLNQNGGLVVGKSLSPSEVTLMPAATPSKNLPEIQRKANSVLKTLVAA